MELPEEEKYQFCNSMDDDALLNFAQSSINNFHMCRNVLAQRGISIPSSTVLGLLRRRSQSTVQPDIQSPEPTYKGLTTAQMQERLTTYAHDYSNCSEPIDMASQMEWTESPPDLKIKFLPTDPTKPSRINCYQRESLQQWVSNPDNTFARWVQNPEAQPMHNQGFGGMPDLNERYFKLYTGEFILDDKFSRSALKYGQMPASYIATPIGVVRIGNLRGTFQTGETHGQAPGYMTYKLRHDTSLFKNNM